MIKECFDNFWSDKLLVKLLSLQFAVITDLAKN